ITLGAGITLGSRLTRVPLLTLLTRVTLRPRLPLRPRITRIALRACGTGRPLGSGGAGDTDRGSELEARRLGHRDDDRLRVLPVREDDAHASSAVTFGRISRDPLHSRMT